MHLIFHARGSDVTPQTNDVTLILLLGTRIAIYLSILTTPAIKLKAIDVLCNLPPSSQNMVVSSTYNHVIISLPTS